jgi:hypothetical protein
VDLRLKDLQVQRLAALALRVDYIRVEIYIMSPIIVKILQYDTALRNLVRVRKLRRNRGRDRV